MQARRRETREREITASICAGAGRAPLRVRRRPLVGGWTPSDPFIELERIVDSAGRFPEMPVWAVLRLVLGNRVRSPLVRAFGFAYGQVALETLHGRPLDAVERVEIGLHLLTIARVAPAALDEPAVPVLRIVFREWVRDPEGAWVRPLEAWRPASRSPRRLADGLLRHVFFLETVEPRFRDALLERDDPWDTVALRLGRGWPLRRALEGFPRGMPRITRRLVRLFATSPDDLVRECSLRYLIRRAQFLALGGEEWAARRVGWAFGSAVDIDEERWEGALAWLVGARPLLDWDYLRPWLRFVEERFAADPDWSLRRRDPEEVIAQLRAWMRARELEERRPQLATEYPVDGNVPWRVEVTDPDGGTTLWSFRQIRLGRELDAEGERMRHCIFSYHEEIEDGDCSIWSLGRDGEPTLTIEVRDDAVAEVRGRFNRTADAAERAIIARWAERNDLRVDEYAHDE